MSINTACIYSAISFPDLDRDPSGGIKQARSSKKNVDGTMQNIPVENSGIQFIFFEMKILN